MENLLIIAPTTAHFAKRVLKPYLILFFIGLFPLMSMLCFEGNSTNLTLHVSNLWGGWKNPTYQLEVWKTIFTDPNGFFIAMNKGGPLYVVYLLALLTGLENYLPDIVFTKYPEFAINTLIKSILIYSLPFVLFLIFEKFDPKIIKMEGRN